MGASAITTMAVTSHQATAGTLRALSLVKSKTKAMMANAARLHAVETLVASSKSLFIWSYRVLLSRPAYDSGFFGLLACLGGLAPGPSHQWPTPAGRAVQLLHNLRCLGATTPGCSDLLPHRGCPVPAPSHQWPAPA